MVDHKLISSLLLSVFFIIVGCSTIQHEPVSNRTSHFMCFDQDKSKEHYFTNTFTLEPTAEQKHYEVWLVKRKMEKQLQIELVDCREIDAEDMPNDLDFSLLKN